MSYGKFVDQIARHLENDILAYDSLPNHQGCVLYLRGSIKSVEVDISAIGQDVKLLVPILRNLIQHSTTTGSVRVSLHDGQLTVIEQ